VSELGSGTIDLRSDTLTRPSVAMRRAMAEAEVGDDVYGEDPSARRLQERMAELLGKPAALFVPTGTMANQLALLSHCERGNDVLVGEGSHCMVYEAGAAAALAQVQFSVVGQGGLFDAGQALAAIKPNEYHHPQTRLCVIENTHNRAGGRVFPQADVQRIASALAQRGVRVHIDGARLWNAAIASGASLSALAAPADSVSVCFSKGLAAPAGSVLAGSVELIGRARRYRKMLGGGMRQVGVLCAAALHAVEHHVERLADDHENARHLAQGLAAHARLRCDPQSVETNIVMFDVVSGSAEAFVSRALDQGVLLTAVSATRIRAVTHRDLDRDAIDRAVSRLALC
jgi:threonine aldolase